MRGVSHLINQTNFASKAAIAAVFCFLGGMLPFNDTLLTNFQNTCSWLTLFWSSSTMTILPQHQQTGTHKADGCDNSFPTLSGLREEDRPKGVTEKGRKPSSHSVLDRFSQWHPVATDLQIQRKHQTVMGDKATEMHTEPTYLCLCLALHISAEQIVLFGF